ncbi:MAG: acyl-ACP--UDP-N-acetylglucosamine O-acyltransferase [Atribacterota bacterium]|nr:acyl-ACP--UDP-N-acetylglucosamine O-acyltransferase [Candidatus Atribacteria bacterium]
MKIDTRAVIEEGAQLGDEVEVGPFAVIGHQVRVGNRTCIGSGVIMEGRVSIGSDCTIGHHAVIGTPPQDISYRGDETEVIIGDETVLREFSTVHRATGVGKSTCIGKKCFIMSYCHIAHNCQIGNEVIMANNASLAGYVEVEDGATLSGFVGIHQFVRVGKLTMIGGLSKVVLDIPPYCLADGHPARLFGQNVVGLKRRGFSRENREIIKKIYQILFKPGTTEEEALHNVAKEYPGVFAEEIISFIQKSRRGIARAVRETKRTSDVY